MVLQLRRVAKAYQGGGRRVSVLGGVDLAVAAGEQVVLTGASGAGKTTLLNLAGLLDRPDAGDVVFDGVRVTGGGNAFASSLRLRQVGFVFQHHYLAPDLTVWENTMFPALAARTEAAHVRVSDLLDLVGLAELADRLPRELSGGEQQRACLARALVNSPRLILADEPTASLDAENATQVARLLGHAQAEGAAILVATHEPSRFPDATRIERLEGGRLTIEALP